MLWEAKIGFSIVFLGTIELITKRNAKRTFEAVPAGLGIIVDCVDIRV